VNAKPGAVPPAHFGEGGSLGFRAGVLFAFIGGLILNIMPCVLRCWR